MKTKTKKFLKSKKIVTSLPVNIKFKIKGKSKGFKTITAMQGTEVVPWKDVLKAFRIEREEIKRIIENTNSYTMAYILDEDIEEWLE